MAEGHLKGKQMTNPGDASKKPLLSLSLSNLKPKFSLAAALKVRDGGSSRLPNAEPMEVSLSTDVEEIKAVELQKTPVSIMTHNEAIADKLIPMSVSYFARILCSTVSKQTTPSHSPGWSYKNQLRGTRRAHRSSAAPYPTNKSFEFDTPSPDDIVLAKQRRAFTRYGQSRTSAQ